MNDDLAETVIHDVCLAFSGKCTFDFDDDVFLEQSDVYSDITTQPCRHVRPQSVEMPTRRRASDVIDSLGEEFVTLRTNDGSPPSTNSVPVSPRSRNSSDLGYSGSPSATHFSFPSAMYPPASARNNNTTDSRPIGIHTEQEAKDVPEGRMPVARDADAYNMGHARRGRAVIFNHESFDNNMAAQRLGSQVDVAVMERAFADLGFQVSTFNDCTHQEIKNIIQDLSREDHSDADCLAVTVLSHGMENGLLFARDALYRVESLWMPLQAENCASLAGKPKIFFIQACRGDKLDGGVTLVSQRRARTTSMSETDSGTSAYKIPSYGDFLISYSAMDGYFSWRNPLEGTWYVQSLAEELRLHGKTRSMTDILTRVSRRVALTYESNVEDKLWMHCQKQCPIFHSSLMRDVILLPKT